MNVIRIMKKGLLIYPVEQGEIFNIGDYIQSIAARQFIGIPEIMIDRENLNNYDGEKVAMIMNGWYMHKPENWPPSDKIEPLFVALHINKSVEVQLLSKKSIEYFKKHEPIGCRDLYTKQKLEQHGVRAYFSGCMTLTLGNTYNHVDEENALIYFTDVISNNTGSWKFRRRCILIAVTKLNLIKKIQKRMVECGYYLTFKSVVAFYATYSSVFEDEVFLKAIYRKQQFPNTFNSENEKFLYADSVLQDYSKARYVVTSRIHCALPCLAMGTPVLYVNNENLGEVHNCRMDGLVQLFHKINIEGEIVTNEISDVKIGVDYSFNNKNDYQVLSNNLISKCKEYLKKIGD